MKAPIFSLIKPFWPRIILAATCGIICNVSVIGLMGVSAYLIISAGLKVPLYLLSTAIVAVRAFGIFRASFRYLERYFSHTAAFRIWEELRIYIYERAIAALPLTSRPMRRGDFLHLIVKALDDLRDAVLRVLMPPLTAGIVVLGLVVYLSFYSLAASMIIIVAFALIVAAVPVTCLVRHNRPTISMSDEIWDFIDGAREMLVYRYGDRCAQRALRQAARLDEVETEDFELTAAALAYGRFVSALAVLALLLIFIAEPDKIAPIDAVVLLFSCMAAFEIIVPLSGLGEQVLKAKAAWRDLDAILKAHSDSYPAAANDADENEVCAVEKLSFSYAEGQSVYKSLDMLIGKGEKVVLTGPSGTGKSTLVKLLLKLFAYSGGAIYQEGAPYDTLDDVIVRSKIRVALQDQYIFDLTVREHFALLYEGIDDAAIAKALSMAGLDYFIADETLGLDAPLGQNGCLLSGGERRRFSLALALADEKAPFLLLDEPTAGLDVLTAKGIIDTIHALPKEKSVLLITHDMSCVMGFDHIFIVGDGKIIEEGSPVMLLVKKGVFVDMMQRRNLI